MMITRINDVVNQIQQHLRAKMMVVHLNRLAPSVGAIWDDQPSEGSSVMTIHHYVVQVPHGLPLLTKPQVVSHKQPASRGRHANISGISNPSSPPSLKAEGHLHTGTFALLQDHITRQSQQQAVLEPSSGLFVSPEQLGILKNEEWWH
jgi:hypothetical protein